MLPLPPDLIKRVEKSISNFLWVKQDKIRRRSIIYPLIDGGLHMIDVSSFFESLKTTWIYIVLKMKRIGPLFQIII